MAALMWLITCQTSFAHKPSDSHLTLAIEGDTRVAAHWDIAIRDLEQVIGLDSNGDARITWGEVKQHRQAIYAHAFSHLKIHGEDKQCQLEQGDLKINRHVDGQYAALLFDAICSQTNNITVTYNLLFDIDPTHRGLLQVRRGELVSTHILSPDSPEVTTSAAASPSSAWRNLTEFVGHGIWHIWIGLDHLLFLACLLLPSVMRKQTAEWIGVDNFSDAFKSLLIIVTAFTVAHSITLSIAVLGLLTLPGKLVESGIAASIILVAVFNLTPSLRSRWRHDRWLLAFAFGLLHGFGFAGVLSDLQLPPGALATSLAGFNIGVELGQLAIIAVAFPVAFYLRNTRFYSTAILGASSVFIIMISSWWVYERALLP